MIENILFDLDGTLTEPFEGITNSVLYALRKCGIEEGDRAKLKAFIGPPLLASFSEFYGMTQEEARRAVSFYREYYAEKGIFENAVIAGIPELLYSLRNEGCSLFVATSKPEPFAGRIIERFALSPYIARVFGASLDETRTEKGEVIAYALKEGGRSLADLSKNKRRVSAERGRVCRKGANDVWLGIFGLRQYRRASRE